MKDRLSVYIGRFSPFHAGHAAVLRHALKKSDRVLVLIGSAGQPRTIKNPWTYEERRDLIVAWGCAQAHSLSLSEQARLTFAPLPDTPYNDQLWLADVQAAVAAALASMPADTDVYVVGADKDASSYYLGLFPGWKLDLAEPVADGGGGAYSATTIRDRYFSGHCTAADMGSGLAQTGLFLFDFAEDKPLEYQRLRDEYSFIQDYRAAWSAAPYAPTFKTVDAVVVHSGHVLLVRRKHMLGEGLLALPGGFIGQDETLFDAAVRELREETGLKVPDPVLRSNCVRREIFDHPGRSLRGRTITTAHLFVLNPDYGLPEVRGSDDAAWAGWVKLGDVRTMRDQLYEDHFAIIETMVAGNPNI